MIDVFVDFVIHRLTYKLCNTVIRHSPTRVLKILKLLFRLKVVFNHLCNVSTDT